MWKIRKFWKNGIRKNILDFERTLFNQTTPSRGGLKFEFHKMESQDQKYFLQKFDKSTLPLFLGSKVFTKFTKNQKRPMAVGG
jgi:hypothetical protein